MERSFSGVILPHRHRKHSFVDELGELLDSTGIEFDEKYLGCVTSGTPPGAVMTNDFAGGLGGL